jgi:hypothetical protein
LRWFGARRFGLIIVFSRRRLKSRVNKLQLKIMRKKNLLSASNRLNADRSAQPITE